MIKISVIVPTFNRADLLPKTVNSVLQQSFSNFELIIVNDGSPDHTDDVIAEYKDSRINYIKQKNKGLAGARNTGIENARGSYITWLDDDDQYLPDHLEIMYDAMEDAGEGYGFAYTSADIVDESGALVTSSKDSQLCLSGDILEYTFFNYHIIASSMFVRREFFKELRFDPQLRQAEDLDFALHILTKTKALFVKKSKIIYLQTPGSLGKNHKQNYFKSFVLERFYNEVRRKNILPEKKTRKKIASCYLRAGNHHLNADRRKAAIYMYRKTVTYQPSSLKAYFKIFQAMLKGSDEGPDWEPLTP
ncbi:MAG: glycosyltransferase family 2 protein [Deltaproteobacteria bacterium]|nr:glycosyltransferase family 2 protein [Deltaproteobacteria bacterium]MBW2562680.1 glycosyltransferase family 2 protein [Deltaproteobacteria bacterium]